MNVGAKHFESIWIREDDPFTVQLIDQRYLPFELKVEDVSTPEDMLTAIRDMHVRGAPLIGAAGALGVYLAVVSAPAGGDYISYVKDKASLLAGARPTAVNLARAVGSALEVACRARTRHEAVTLTRAEAMAVINGERMNSIRIGRYGLPLIKRLSREKAGKPVNILTHCNAGWLACIDYGTATAPIYLAHDAGIKVHVIVDETRPRNQGARLTAWELEGHGVPCTVVVDNAGGYMMQQGMVDMVITGCDRVSPYGDVVNKTGTYLKALAAKDNDVPFYVALPSSTIDWTLSEGAGGTVIEERDGEEVIMMEGIDGDGRLSAVRIMDRDTKVSNYGFDITPSRLVTGLITERGIAREGYKGIAELFPDKIPFYGKNSIIK